MISILMCGFRFFYGEGGGFKGLLCLPGWLGGWVQRIFVYARGEPGVRALFLVILVWENNTFGFSREAPFPLVPRMILIRQLDKIFVLPQSSDKGN